MLKGGGLLDFLLYSLCALPLLGAIFAVYFILRRAGLMRESLIAKCSGSFLAVVSAGLGLHLGGRSPIWEPVFWFLVLCTAADALLEISFVPGMLLFGGAHACLIIWLWGLAPAGWGALIIWLLAYGVTAWLFRKELPKLGKLLLPFCLYPALLGASLALGLCLPFTAGPGLWPVAAGTLCFFVSDMMVAKGQLSGLDPKWHKPVMLLYWAALYLISAALW